METIDPRQDRANRIGLLRRDRFDVLVVGGGIVGAGVARDAALRGLRVGLVEQHDFASGTSSSTSRLLHGGIRYLAQGQIALVLQSSREKRILRHIAPHLAEPLPFVFPAYQGSGWPLWKLRIGVKLYDVLCGSGRNLGPSCSMSHTDVLRRLPHPEGRALAGAVRYYDGFTNDARLVVDTLRSAAASGATLANYAKLEEASRAGGGWRCEVRDAVANRELEIHARAVVHATGPWAQQLSQSNVRLRLTKGVHLVIDHDRLPLTDAVVMTEGRRVLFAIPWHERVILGTTDTDYDGPIEAVRTEATDVDAILAVVNRTFPSAALDRRDILSTWAGLRPLIADKHGGPSDISRAHQIHMAQPGWFDVAGGKLTTYRLIGEQVVDALVAYLGPQRPRCRTAELPLVAAEEADASRVVPPQPSEQLVAHFCRYEWAVHLDDVMARRGGWQHYCRDAQAVAAKITDWMGGILEWDSTRRQSESARWRERPR